MAQKEIEIILSRHLASCLTVPMLIVDPEGTLLYYNEPAERIVGQRFDATGEVPARRWLTATVRIDRKGRPLPPDSLPVMVALDECRPARGSFWVQGRDGVRRHIEVVAVPLIGQANRFVGGMALFWEVGKKAFRAAPVEKGAPAASSRPIELILVRQLASYLALPIMIFDLQGTLIFYNEPAESILGERFEETGEILATDLSHLYNPMDENGVLVPPERSPTRIALFQHHPAYNRFWIWGRDGVRRDIELDAFPLIGRAEHFLGVISLMWENHK